MIQLELVHERKIRRLPGTYLPTFMWEKLSTRAVWLKRRVRYQKTVPVAVAVASLKRQGRKR